jgi:hypothetical protein
MAASVRKYENIANKNRSVVAAKKVRMWQRGQGTNLSADTVLRCASTQGDPYIPGQWLGYILKTQYAQD